jgi:hypothetical protein
VSDFDHAAGFATQAAPEAVTARLTRRAGERFAFQGWHTTRAISLPGGPKRTPDLVAVLDALDVPTEPALLVYELQSEHDEEKLETTLLEAAVFRAHARHGADGKGRYRVFAGLVYLKGECPRAVLDMRSKSGLGTRHEAMVWDAAKDDAAQALQAVELGAEHWGLLFWIALMTGADQEDIIRRWLELVNTIDIAPSMRRNLIVVALALAQLAGRFLIWERILEGANMGEAIIYNRIRAQGALEQARHDLIRLLQAKFKASMTAEFKETVEQQKEVDLLNRWYDSALEHDTWDAFVASLK